MVGVTRYVVTEPFVKSDCGLGEAPYWEEKTNTLRFVDIVKKNLHEVNLNIGPSSHRVFANLDISVGTTADIAQADANFVFGGKHGIGIFDRTTASYRYIKKFWSPSEVDSGKEHRMRANDGAVDSQGRYWVSTMNDPEVTEPTDEGVLFRLDPDLSLHRVIENVSIPNGISWTKDDTTMYFTDSPTQSIFAYDYDAKSGSISNRRVFFQVNEEGCVPDGHAQDVEGHLWVAIHGAGKVVRVSPQGHVVAEIHLPTRCISVSNQGAAAVYTLRSSRSCIQQCPGFCNEDLYVTSAAEEEPDKYPQSAILQGSLFKIHVGVKGQVLHKFRLQGA